MPPHSPKLTPHPPPTSANHSHPPCKVRPNHRPSPIGHRPTLLSAHATTHYFEQVPHARTARQKYIHHKVPHRTLIPPYWYILYAVQLCSGIYGCLLRCTYTRVHYGTLHYSTLQYTTVHCVIEGQRPFYSCSIHSTPQHSTVHYSTSHFTTHLQQFYFAVTCTRTVQYGTIILCTIQYSTIQYIHCQPNNHPPPTAHRLPPTAHKAHSPPTYRGQDTHHHQLHALLHHQPHNPTRLNLQKAPLPRKSSGKIGRAHV